MRRRGRTRARLQVYAALIAAAAVPQAARAGDAFDLTVPPAAPAPQQTADTAATPAPPVETGGIDAYFAEWSQRVAYARATQPSWSSPVVTTTGLLEQRVRFDVDQQNGRGGQQTTVYDGGKGLDLIVSDTNEIQVAAAPYDVRTTPNGKNQYAGFGDWPFLRVEQRLASSPASGGNYVLTGWVSFQAPAGIEQITANTWEFTPTLAFGKGFGDFDVQGTVGLVVPASYVDVVGHQLQGNIAFQYHVLRVLWPEVELNWTHYIDGARGGRNVLYVTPGLVVGRIALTDTLKLTLGVAYQTAVTRIYATKPATPSYQNALLVTSRLNF